MALPIHLIVPMSGRGRRFARAGYTVPKPLVAVDGRPMIEQVLAHYPSDWPSHFVVSQAHCDTALYALLRQLRPSASLEGIASHDHGPSFAVRAALRHVPAQAPVLVSYCDFGLRWDARAFESMVHDSGCDACLVSYRGYQPHYASLTPYAYSRLIGEQVVEVREKGSFTAHREGEYASAGAYYFKSRRLLEDALAAQERYGLRALGELYTSLTVQALLLARAEAGQVADVRVFEAEGFYQWGTPEDLADYNHWRRAVRTWLRAAPARARPKTGSAALAAFSTGHDDDGYCVDQLAMPMAGRGSRLAAMARAPKPLVVLKEDAAMFSEALATLPRPLHARHFAALAGHRERLQPLLAGLPGPPSQVAWLERTPPGQAFSTLEALAGLDDDAEVLVSACDHGIAVEPATWRAFRAAPACEAAIFGICGYPGATRAPDQFAYVALVPSAWQFTAAEATPRQGCAGYPGGQRELREAFPRVAQVAVKLPLSARPADDHVVTGTFWFRRVGRLKEAIAAIERAGAQVNAELYLDSVFPWLLAAGDVVRLVPVDGFFNWGTPDALNESQHWLQALGGMRPFVDWGAADAAGRRAMVEPIGIEPTTSGLQSPRSPS